MSLQARMTAEDPRLYNPSRDVAHNFHSVMKLVADRLEDHAWPELDEVLKREGVTLDDTGEACGAYCTYLSLALTAPDMTMHAGLESSKFFECKPAAQIAVLALIGTCYAGIQFDGIREASLGGKGPMETVADLIKHAEEFRAYSGVPRWRRKLMRAKARIKQAIQVLRKPAK
jgi:hypothetical protein